MAQPTKPPRIEHVDVAGVTETFADAVGGVVFDGQTMRLEFCVTRVDEPLSADAQITGKRYTACRIVLPPAAAMQLSSKLSQIARAIVTAGARARGRGSEAAAKDGEAAATPVQ